MLILGIESSCDDTAIAIVENGNIVRESVVISQYAAHQDFGGVVPEIASREHLKNLLEAFAIATKTIPMEKIDAVAVTQGPGLLGSLLVGTLFAKGLALRHQKPLIPINHVHAHIFSALLDQEKTVDEIFPSLALVVSGGHTNLYFMPDAQTFKLVGHTLDDACGECFDKVAKMLGLPYPGGPEIEKRAADFKTEKSTLRFPIPKVTPQQFSFSGLKTALYYYILKHPGAYNINEVCYAFQEAALGQIVEKIKWHTAALKPALKSVIVSGGVSANLRFQNLFMENISVPMLFPQKKYCSDNAAMIASNAYYAPQAAGPNWDVFARYPFEHFLSAEVSL